ncbi:MAG: cysteate synthase, partial [Bacteroidales bacterium]|nr:cysteate synthase [Bacteroidales bacterium]
QNYPFIPIYDAWKAGSRDILAMDDEVSRKQVAEIDAKVLSNRKPPYSVIGGLFDALTDTGGDVLVANNQEAIIADELFQKTEGIDLHPAAAIAAATLLQAVRQKKVEPDANIMLNITGGGEARFKADNPNLHFLKPKLVFDYNPDPEEVIRKVEALF